MSRSYLYYIAHICDCPDGPGITYMLTSVLTTELLLAPTPRWMDDVNVTSLQLKASVIGLLLLAQRF